MREHYGLMPDLKSDRVLPSAAQHSYRDYLYSEVWQRYLNEEVRDKARLEYLLLHITDAVDDWSLKIGATPGVENKDCLTATARVPADWFVGKSQHETAPIFQTLQERFFTELHERGYTPAPPPVPTLTVRDRPPPWFGAVHFGDGTRQCRMGVSEQLLRLFSEDERWDSYSREVDPMETFKLWLDVEKRDRRYRRLHRRKNGEVALDIRLPTSELTALSPEAITRHLQRTAYEGIVFVADKLGWPEPPPMPE